MAYNYRQEQTGLPYYVHEFTLALTVGNNAVRAITTKSRELLPPFVDR